MLGRPVGSFVGWPTKLLPGRWNLVVQGRVSSANRWNSPPPANRWNSPPRPGRRTARLPRLEFMLRHDTYWVW